MKRLIENWAKEVEKLPIRKLTPDEVSLYVNLYMQRRVIDNDINLLESLNSKKLGMASVIWLRVKHCHSYKITPSLALYLGQTVLENFGHCTIMANYLQYFAHKFHLLEVNLMNLHEKIFPHGYLTEESFRKAWDMQKVTPELAKKMKGSDNILDYIECQDSIKGLEYQ